MYPSTPVSYQDPRKYYSYVLFPWVLFLHSPLSSRSSLYSTSIPSVTTHPPSRFTASTQTTSGDLALMGEPEQDGHLTTTVGREERRGNLLVYDRIPVMSIRDTGKRRQRDNNSLQVSRLPTAVTVTAATTVMAVIPPLPSLFILPLLLQPRLLLLLLLRPPPRQYTYHHHYHYHRYYIYGVTISTIMTSSSANTATISYYYLSYYY